MGLTDAQIQIKFNSLEKDISEIQNALSQMQDDIRSRLHLSELQVATNELRALISDNSDLIVDIEKRIAKVLLPEETQYYLEEGDVESFKSNFSKLKAMMARFERLYNNLVAYQARITQ
jgi:Mg2+ and Co2+ transporter CorA